MPLALPALGGLVLALWAIALALALVVLIEALSKWAGSIPVVGGHIAGALNAMGQWLANAAGTLEGGVDKLIGYAWHLTARFMDSLWQQFVGHALLLAHLAQLVASLFYAHSGLRALVHLLEREYHGIEHGVRDLIRRWHGIEHRVRALEHEIAVGIGHDVLGRLRAVEGEIGHIEAGVIPAIESADQQAASAINNLYDWVRGKASLLGVGTFTFAVATALSALGLDWLKCKENPFNNNSQACGLWSVLGRVLGLAAFLTAAFDFPLFVGAARVVATGIGDSVASIEGQFALALPPLPPPL